MSLFQELKRRNVFRVAVAYVVATWLLLQVVDVLGPILTLPEWAGRFVFLLLLIGFPIALIFAWAFELTPEGIKKEKDVDRSQSITSQTGRKLDFAIIGILGVAVVFLLVDKFILQPEPAEPTILTTPQTAEAPVTELVSVAVLPFVDMSPAKDQDYFTDGLTENLLNALAQIREFKVAGRTSSFAFKSRNEDLRSIGEQLNVRNILEGSVQKAGDRVRITTQLVNTNDGFHLWSETFDRNLDDIFAVQDEIAAAVVKALRKSILGQDEIDTGYAGNIDAINAYWRGQSFHAQKNFEGWEKAIEQYRQALEIDPDMALAWAGLSETIADQTGFTSDFADGYEQARQAAQKAIELDPELPEAHLAMAEVYRSHDWDWAAVEQSLRRAQELRPGDPDIRARLASLLEVRGNVADALLQIDQVLSQDPLNVNVQVKRAWDLLFLGRMDEALLLANHLIETNPGRGALGTLLSVIHHDRGEFELALKAAEREPFPFLRLTVESMAYYGLGDLQSSEEKLNQLVDEYGDDVSYQVAAIYSRRGDADRAFEALDRGYAVRDPGLVLIQSHTAFDPLRDDPRYDALLRKMGLR